MLYQPQPFFNVQAAVGQSLIAAISRAAVDYIVGEGKPWAFYVGYGVGGAALATGIEGARATLYAGGALSLKLYFEKSPGAADIAIFLDGVAEANLSLDDDIVQVLEHVLNIPDDGLNHSIAILNMGTNPLSLNPVTDWLSILGVEYDGFIAAKEYVVADLFLVSCTIRDAKTLSTARKRNKMPVSFFFPVGALTLAQITAVHDAVLAAVDGVTGGVIESSSISLFPELPAGLKANPEAASDVQEGALLSFDLTNSNYVDSVFIPAVKQSLVGADGQSIDIADALITALMAELTVVGTATSPASNRFGVTYNDLAAAEKTFRK